MRRIVVIVENVSARQVNGITRFLKEKSGARFWHYVENVWLLRDPRDRSAGWWRRTVEGLVETGEDTRIIAMSVDVRAWSGRGPSVMFAWLRGWRTRSDED